MQAVIYHNPRCSKSRATLALLEQRGVQPTVIEYLKNPPSQAELRRLLGLLDKRPAELIRFKDALAKDLGLKPGDDRDDVEWLALLHANPALLERPVVEIDGRAALGRPPESVLDLLR